MSGQQHPTDVSHAVEDLLEDAPSEENIDDVDDIATDVESRIENDTREELEASRPSVDERQTLLGEHHHHLVRETTSQVTLLEGDGIQIETTIEARDIYCFTCEEWVGISGVELTGTPRSKADAFYLRGPPPDVQEAEDLVRDQLASLAEHVLETVDHIEDAEDAVEFVGDQHEQLTAALDEVDR